MLKLCQCVHISIHASLAGGDADQRRGPHPDGDFNPRLPRGRRPGATARSPAASGNFNPRLPRGRRHGSAGTHIRAAVFQSTPPSREATSFATSCIRNGGISIHASLAGGDPNRPQFFRFQPISIHASLAGGDSNSQYILQAMPISIHASLAGGDLSHGIRHAGLEHFNPRLPRGRRRQDIPLFCLWNTTYGNSCEFVVRGCCFSLTFVAEKRRISTCFGANRPGKWAQLPLRTTGNFTYDLLLGR